jgi:hypothetical protein
LSNIPRIPAYLLVALIGAFQLSVLWLVLNPDVSPDYRGYYLAETTTCLNQPVSGLYAGGMVSFLPPGSADARPLKVCGWEGPAGDGTHAVGTSSRLRFVLGEPPADPTLRLDLIAVARAGTQRVDVTVNGLYLDQITVGTEEPARFDIPIPPETAADSGGRYEVTLGFPEAMSMGPTDPDTRWRSVKLLAAGIVERGSSL